MPDTPPPPPTSPTPPTPPTPSPSPAAEHILVAAWPGMGNVGVIAAAYLVQRANIPLLGELPSSLDILPTGGIGWRFEPQAVEIRQGVIQVPRMPRNLLYYAPEGHILHNRLTVFIAEAQPTFGGPALAQALLDKAKQLGCTRVLTLAAMASQIHPMSEPRVHGAVTSVDLVGELEKVDARPIPAGQIGGLNGVLLGAAALRGWPGLCLMGEIPFFAPGVPNPKAARAVLETFSTMTGLPIQVDELTEQARAIDQMLTDMHERMQSGGGGGEPSEGSGGLEPWQMGQASEPDTDEATGDPSGAAASPPPPALDKATTDRIEMLFISARTDKTAARALKAELDRLGVFKQYENRFLDLFRRAE